MMTWDGHPFFFPPTVVVEPAANLACRHDPCWCGRPEPVPRFAPWSEVGEQMFYADRMLARGELPPTIRVS